MSSEPLNPDDDSIPVLENPLNLDELESADALKSAGALKTPEAATDRALMAAFLQTPAVQDQLNALSRDLQKQVSAALQALLEEQLPRLIKQATEASAPRLAEDIRSRLQQELPGLLDHLAGSAQQPDQQD
jgi:hypothetical protein